MRSLAIANRAGIYSYHFFTTGLFNNSVRMFYFELWIQQVIRKLFGLTWVNLIVGIPSIKESKQYLGYDWIFNKQVVKWHHIYTGRIWIFTYQDWIVIRINYIYMPASKSRKSNFKQNTIRTTRQLATIGALYYRLLQINETFEQRYIYVNAGRRRRFLI